MKALWMGCGVALLAVNTLADPTITAFLSSGELIASNLTVGTTATVEWASTAAGPWTNTWSNLAAIPVGTSGTIRVGVPFFYRLQVTADALAPLSPGTVAIIRMSAGLDNFTVLALRDLDASLVLRWTDEGWTTTNAFRSGGNEGAGNTDVLTNTIPAGSTFEVSGNNFVDTGEQIFLFAGTKALPSLLFGVDWGNAVGWDADSTNTFTSADPAVTGGGLSDVHTVSVGSANDWQYTGIQTGTVAALLAAISDNTQWASVTTNVTAWTNGVFTVL